MPPDRLIGTTSLSHFCLKELSWGYDETCVQRSGGWDWHLEGGTMVEEGMGWPHKGCEWQGEPSLVVVELKLGELVVN